MALSKSVSPDGTTVTIRINGRFDFSMHQEFRDAWSGNGAAQRYVVDLAGTEYLDSAACGMLLVFRDSVGGNHAEISLVNAAPEIRKTLSMLQFHRLFKIV